MKKRIAIAYLVGIHLLLAVVLLKSDFIDRVQPKFGIQADLPAEITQHYHRMLRYHKRMDGNVPNGSVLFIGDSITQGLCVSAVALPSVNYGIGSDTTLGVLQRLPEYKSIDKASTVVLAIGINDMKRRSNEDILKNYRSIIEHIPQNIPIVISAILPLDEESRPEWEGRNQDRIKNLNISLESIAKTDSRIFSVNAGSLLTDTSGNLADRFHDGDGVHLNSEGNGIWINVLRDGIQRAQQGAALDGDSAALHPRQ